MEIPMQLSSFVLVEKGDRYLLICEASKKWKGHWFFPGGKLNKDESPDVSVLRETEEEAGCEVTLTGLFFFACYGRLLNHKKLHIYYVGKPKTSKVKKFADKHSLEAGWFTYEEILRLPLRENALEIIEAYRKKKLSLPLYNLKILDKSIAKDNYTKAVA